MSTCKSVKKEKQQPEFPADLRLLTAVPGVEDLTRALSYCGYVTTKAHSNHIKRKYEETSKSSFSMWYETGSFGFTDFKHGSHKLHWELPIRKEGVALPFLGIPFFIVGSKVFDCQYGKDRNIKKKATYAAKLQEGEHQYRKRKVRAQPSKKCNCPAQIVMKELIVFPEFAIELDTKRRKTTVSTTLRAFIQEDGIDSVKTERRIYIALPHPSNHCNHVFRESSEEVQPLDQQLVTKVQELVGEGVRTVTEVKRALRLFVRRVLFWNDKQPPLTNRRFFPNKLTIEHHITEAIVRQRLDRLDQDNVAVLMGNWANFFPHDFSFFREYKSFGTEDFERVRKAESGEEDGGKTSPVSPLPGESRFLVVYQTPWQSHLLLHYGQNVSFLDAVHRTTQYSLPLFLLTVKTNVDYQVVAVFAVQEDTAAAITEALRLIRRWNPAWRPHYFMVSLVPEELSAVSNTFPDCQVLVCDFHREQAWQSWVSAGEHGVGDCCEAVLARLRRVARSCSSRDYQAALHSLQASPHWTNNPRLHNWFTKTWLKYKERWAWAWRPDNLLTFLGINNGLEKQTQAFRSEQHPCVCSPSLCLSAMLRALIEDFLPAAYKKYVQMNTAAASLYTHYQTQVPVFLQALPPHILQHCMQRLAGLHTIPPGNVTVLSEARKALQVRSQDSGVIYNVCFGNESQMPRCDCLDWQRWFFPCQHFLAVFRHMEKWQWSVLPAAYRTSPFLTLDQAVLCKAERSDNARPDLTLPDQTSDLAAGVCAGDADGGSLPLKAQQFRCAELLTRLNKLTYDISQEDVLGRLEDSLLGHILDLQHCGQLYTERRHDPATASPPAKRKKHTQAQQQDGGAAAMLSSENSRMLNSENSHMLSSENSHILGSENSRMLNSENSHILGSENNHMLNSENSHMLSSENNHVLSSETSHMLSSENNHVLSSENNHMLNSEVRHVLNSENNHVLTSESSHVLTSETRHMLSSEPSQVTMELMPAVGGGHSSTGGEVVTSDDLGWDMVEVTAAHGITVCHLVQHDTTEDYVVQELHEQPGGYLVQQPPGGYIVHHTPHHL